MKKIALFVSVLLLAGSLFAAAPAFEAKPAISGDATLTWGIALDGTIATGFANATSNNLTLHLVNKDSDEKGGKEGEEVYGWIKLKDFEMNIDGSLSITKPAVEAKLFLGPVYINILGDSNATNKTGTGGVTKNVSGTLDIGITNDKDTNALWDVLGLTPAANTADSNPGAEFAGLYLGLKDTSVVDVKLGVQSASDWKGAAAGAPTYTIKWVDSSYTLATDGSEAYTGHVTLDSAGNIVSRQVRVTTAGTAADPANTANTYNFWVSADLNAVPGLIFGVKANFTTASAYGFGVKAGYGITVAEGIKITPEAGFDYNSAGAYRVEGGVGVTLPGSNLDDYTKLNTKVDIKPGASVLFAYGSNGAMDLEVALYDGTVIPVLDLVAVAEIYNLGATAQTMGIGAVASADLTQIVPFAAFTYLSAPATTTLQIGADIKVITNTTFTLNYTSGNLSGTAGLGTITAACKIAY